MGRALAGALLVLMLAAVAAGCGSSSTPAASPAPPGTSAVGAGGAQSAAFEAFRSCLQKAGITGFGGRRAGAGTGTNPTDTRPRATTGLRPRGGFGAGRANLTPAQRKAFTACRSKLPAGARFGPGRRGGARNPAFARYTRCLSRHGVTFGSTSTDPAAFRKASAACARYRPSVGGNGGQGQTTTG